ncbi:MAG: precorrin-6y C5,15-methyltransferase (decarboxylating) subunit CbiE [Aliishimia sp.]
MSDFPWLTIVGIGEDGVAGLCASGQAAIADANVIFGPPRHLDLVAKGRAQHIEWPVPFVDGLDILDGLKDQNVVVLASGDPFWFGAGSVIARRYDEHEWRALPGPSCFSLAAARLGWALEGTVCVGLHAAPFMRLKRHLAPGVRIIATLRDGDAVKDIATYLVAQGFGESSITVLEHLGGPAENVTQAQAAALFGTFAHPVCVALNIAGTGAVLTSATGQADDSFESDGQITKRPVRAITLSTLAPKPFEHLWDIGAGSGSIALEWLLAHPTTQATCVEPRKDRADRIQRNAQTLGIENRLRVIHGAAPDALSELAEPDAIFVGGGLCQDVLDVVTQHDVRIVVNAVTLEGEALLASAQAKLGGALMRIALSSVVPLGPKRGWTSAFPVVQWSLTR